MFVINRPQKLENGNSKIDEKKGNVETPRTPRGRGAAKAKHGMTTLNHGWQRRLGAERVG
jgi:hypothetical protein